MINSRVILLILVLVVLNGCVLELAEENNSASSTSPAGEMVDPLPNPPTAPSSTPAPASPYDHIPERFASTPFPTVVMPPAPGANFAFSFGYGSCRISRVLDTFANTLTQYSVMSDPITVTFTLREDEIAPIYRRMVEINVLAYPEEFSITLPATMTRLSTAPHPRYRLTVRNGLLTKTITWDDSIIRPTTTEAENLRSLIRLLKVTIEQHADTKQLPRLIEACA